MKTGLTSEEIKFLKSLLPDLVDLEDNNIVTWRLRPEIRRAFTILRRIGELEFINIHNTSWASSDPKPSGKLREDYIYRIKSTFILKDYEEDNIYSYYDVIKRGGEYVYIWHEGGVRENLFKVGMRVSNFAGAQYEGSSNWFMDRVVVDECGMLRTCLQDGEKCSSANPVRVRFFKEDI